MRLVGSANRPVDLLKLDGRQTCGQLAAQLADRSLALVARPLGGEFPVLDHDPARQHDQDRRGHKNGGEE